MKTQKKTNSKDDLRKWKKIFSKKNKEKGSLKSSQVECFNCGGEGHFALDCLILKRKEKKKKTTMQVT